jgi:hypothetical protein
MRKILIFLLGVLVFGSCSKQEVNYKDAFKLPKGWNLSVQNSANSQNTYSYTNENSENLTISVKTLSNSESKAKKQELEVKKQQAKKKLKEKRQQLKSSAKLREKQLKLNKKASDKQAKQNIKTGVKQLKQDFKKNKPYLKEALKNNKQRLKQTLEFNKKQLKQELETNKEKLKQALLENKTAYKKISIKWWEQPDNQFTAMTKNRVYVATTVGVYGDRGIADLNITPFGFGIGLLDGLIIPFQGAGAIFAKDLHPYKTVNNGAAYLWGFILGCVIWAIALICVMAAIAGARERKRQEERKELERRQWEEKWAAMTVEEKIAYVTEGYNKKQEENNISLQSSVQKYKKLEAEYGTTPEKALDYVRYSGEKNIFEHIGTGFLNIFTAGEVGFDDAKAHYQQVTDVYNYFKSRLDISKYKVDVINTEYNYWREVALLYVQQIKEIKENMTVKQREIFDQSRNIGLKSGTISTQEIQNVINSIDKFNESYQIQAAASFEKTFDFAVGAVGESFSYLNERMNSKDAKFDNVDLAIAGVGAAIGVVSIVGEGIGQYFGNIGKNREAVKEFKAAEIKVIDSVDTIESNRTKYETFAEREKELVDSIKKSIEAFGTVYKNVYEFLYPADDESKSKAARKTRKEQGQPYFTDEDAKEIAKIGSILQMVLKIVDAKL